MDVVVRIPEDLVGFVEAEAANAANLPGGTVDIESDPELAWIGLARVTKALIHGESATRISGSDFVRPPVSDGVIVVERQQRVS